jgi:PIN domain nuclease of toxin-antitoxin system
VHLDTHVLLWLDQGRAGELPMSVRQRLDAEPLVVSPMVGFELDMLREIGRITRSGTEVLAALGDSLGLAVSAAAFPVVARAATALGWTRDPFDRLICAQAIADGDTLLTRDRRIRKHLSVACWD